MKRTLITVNVGVRGAMEAALVAALAAAGYGTGSTTAAHIASGIAVPLVGFGIWGAVDFHQAGRLGEPLRLGQELLLAAVAAVSCYDRGPAALAVTLAALTAVHHTVRIATGQPLLKQASTRPAEHTHSRSGRDTGLGTAAVAAARTPANP